MHYFTMIRIAFLLLLADLAAASQPLRFSNIDDAIGHKDTASLLQHPNGTSTLTYEFCRRGRGGRELAHVDSIAIHLPDQFTHSTPFCAPGAQRRACIEQLNKVNGCLQGSLQMELQLRLDAIEQSLASLLQVQLLEAREPVVVLPRAE